QPFRRVGVYARKMQVAHGIGAARGRSQVAGRVWPSPREAGPKQDDRIGRNRPLALFGRREVIDADLVIRIAVSPGDDVDDDSRTEEPLDRYLIDRLRTPGKMQRGIQVRAAMLRGGEVVRRVI